MDKTQTKILQEKHNGCFFTYNWDIMHCLPTINIANKASTLASLNLKPFFFVTQCSMQSAYLLFTRAPFQHPGPHAEFIFVVVPPRTRRDLSFFSKLCLDCTLLLLSFLFLSLKTRWKEKDQSGKQEVDCTSVCASLSKTNVSILG